MEVTVLAQDYNAGALPFPDALLRLPRLRALTLQIPCKVSPRLRSSSVHLQICTWMTCSNLAISIARRRVDCIC